MRNGKLCGCAALYILLMGMRLVLPEQAEQARAWMQRAVDPGGGCRVFACSLGQELDSTGLKGCLSAVFRLGEETFG